MGGNKGRSLQPVSEETLNKRVISKLDRQRKKIESQVRCVEEILTSDSHPVVRNVVENKISALLGSPSVFRNSPLPASEYAETSVRTPPGMQRRMDMFKERIELHNNSNFLDISPTLIPTQNFLIKTGKKPPAPCLPPKRSPDDPLLSSLVDSDVSLGYSCSITSKTSTDDNYSEPISKKSRVSCQESSLNDSSADMLFGEISCVVSLGNDSNSSRIAGTSRRGREKQLFSSPGMRKNSGMDKENQSPSSENDSKEDVNVSLIPETNEFSFLNFDQMENDYDVDVSRETVPDSLKLVEGIVSQSSDSVNVSNKSCLDNITKVSRSSSIEFNSHMSPIKKTAVSTTFNTVKALTQKTSKRRAMRPKVTCSQPFFTNQVEDFDVFDESAKVSLPKKNKILLKMYPQVVRLSDISGCELTNASVGCSQCHVRKENENIQLGSEIPGKELNEQLSSKEANNSEKPELADQLVELPDQPIESNALEVCNQEQKYAIEGTRITAETVTTAEMNTEEKEHIRDSNKTNEEMSRASVSDCEIGNTMSDLVASMEKSCESASKDTRRSVRGNGNSISNVPETAARSRSRRSIWANQNVDTAANKSADNKPKRVTRSQSGAKSSERKVAGLEKQIKIKSETKKDSFLALKGQTGTRKRKTIIGEPSVDLAVTTSESAPTLEGCVIKSESGRIKETSRKRDASDPRILRDLSLPRKNGGLSSLKKKRGADGNIGQPIVVRSSIDNCNYLMKAGKPKKDIRKTRGNSTAKSGVTKLKRSDSTSNAPVTEIVISATAVSYRQKTILSSAMEALGTTTQSQVCSTDKNGRNVKATFKHSDQDNNWGLEGVTHLVCGKPNRRTLNVLFAIARGCWLLNFDWITDSLEEGNWKLESDYEVKDFPGAKANRERLNQLKVEALKRSKFKPNSKMPLTIKPPRILPPTPLLYVLDGSQPERHVLQCLISLTGGWIVENPLDAKFFIGPRTSVERLKVKNHQRSLLLKIPVLKETWVLDSISEGEQQNIRDYFDSQT